MENRDLKKSYFGLLVLSIIIAASASNGFKHGTGTNSDMALTLINDSNKEIILSFLKRLSTGPIVLPLSIFKNANRVTKSYISRKAKTKSNFRLFNKYSLFNPAGLRG